MGRSAGKAHCPAFPAVADATISMPVGRVLPSTRRKCSWRLSQ